MHLLEYTLAHLADQILAFLWAVFVLLNALR